MSSRFLRVTPRMEAFSLDLLGAVKKIENVLWNCGVGCAKKLDAWNF